MTNVIKTLAQLASDACLQSPQATEQLLINNNIEEAIAKAIISKDVVSLERQLDVCPDIVCLVAPAEDEEENEQEDKDSTEEANNVVGF